MRYLPFILMFALMMNLTAMAVRDITLFVGSILLFGIYFAAKAVIQSREKKE